jgi:uncharacterized protein YbjT (DUF2867 family)
MHVLVTGAAGFIAGQTIDLMLKVGPALSFSAAT